MFSFVVLEALCWLLGLVESHEDTVLALMGLALQEERQTSDSVLYN